LALLRILGQDRREQGPIWPRQKNSSVDPVRSRSLQSRSGNPQYRCHLEERGYCFVYLLSFTSQSDSGLIIFNLQEVCQIHFKHEFPRYLDWLTYFKWVVADCDCVESVLWERTLSDTAGLVCNEGPLSCLAKIACNRTCNIWLGQVEKNLCWKISISRRIKENEADERNTIFLSQRKRSDPAWSFCETSWSVHVRQCRCSIQQTQHCSGHNRSWGLD
jgi:hypothetical protein